MTRSRPLTLNCYEQIHPKLVTYITLYHSETINPPKIIYVVAVLLIITMVQII